MHYLEKRREATMRGATVFLLEADMKMSERRIIMDYEG